MGMLQEHWETSTSKPVDVIVLPDGYSYCQFHELGPYFLCKNEKPLIEVGQYGNDWYASSIEIGTVSHMRAFCERMMSMRYDAKRKGS